MKELNMKTASHRIIKVDDGKLLLLRAVEKLIAGKLDYGP